MQLVFLYGKPATGKLTVARELAALTGYKLFQNQLAVNLLLPVFDFGSTPFVELREEIWLAVFRRAAKERLPGLVFTFAPETTVRPSFVEETIDIVATAGSRVRFVELTCSREELLQRIDAKSRRQSGKLASRLEFERLDAAGVFATSHMPKAEVTIDTGPLKPEEAAEKIRKELRLPRART
ncbi:MAG TPA: AAA family ATPase [Ferrovibrio sp.]|uniref:AAA family ATPase n=1 Tax=Ferrovibrio sp. TaxID=1917215 RepID=UPI002B4B360E|nr:AAA family ATPase [Ferrovibrio sp.]HLT78603.1 AAA family ATPase [Ferrovibrio sp.]